VGCPHRLSQSSPRGVRSWPRVPIPRPKESRLLDSKLPNQSLRLISKLLRFGEKVVHVQAAPENHARDRDCSKSQLSHFLVCTASLRARFRFTLRIAASSEVNEEVQVNTHCIQCLSFSLFCRCLFGTYA
jgi:hypothetical protein